MRGHILLWTRASSSFAALTRIWHASFAVPGSAFAASSTELLNLSMLILISSILLKRIRNDGDCSRGWRSSLCIDSSMLSPNTFSLTSSALSFAPAVKRINSAKNKVRTICKQKFIPELCWSPDLYLELLRKLVLSQFFVSRQWSATYYIPKYRVQAEQFPQKVSSLTCAKLPVINRYCACLTRIWLFKKPLLYRQKINNIRNKVLKTKHMLNVLLNVMCTRSAAIRRWRVSSFLWKPFLWHSSVTSFVVGFLWMLSTLGELNSALLKRMMWQSRGKMWNWVGWHRQWRFSTTSRDIATAKRTIKMALRRWPFSYCFEPYSLSHMVMGHHNQKDSLF